MWYCQNNKNNWHEMEREMGGLPEIKQCHHLRQEKVLQIFSAMIFICTSVTDLKIDVS